MCLVAGSSLYASCPNITPEMEYQMMSQIDISENMGCADDPAPIDNNDPLALHTLDTICENHHNITLTDGSVWHVGFFWRSKLCGWRSGDQIKLTIHFMNTFNFVKIENLDTNVSVWGSLHLRPDIDSPDARWIVDTYLDSLVELNDGSIFETSREYSPTQSQWGPGNIVFVLSNDDPAFPYVLWNMTWNSIIPSTIYAYPPISN